MILTKLSEDLIRMEKEFSTFTIKDFLRYRSWGLAHKTANKLTEWGILKKEGRKAPYYPYKYSFTKRGKEVINELRQIKEALEKVEAIPVGKSFRIKLEQKQKLFLIQNEIKGVL